MATSGPEHYRLAQRYAAEAAERLTDTYDPGEATPRAALAQVHATLAGTAAAMATHLGMTASTEEAWRDATGLARPGRRPVIEGTTEPGPAPEGGRSR